MADESNRTTGLDPATDFLKATGRTKEQEVCVRWCGGAVAWCYRCKKTFRKQNQTAKEGDHIALLA
jgi:hypothetical protein